MSRQLLGRSADWASAPDRVGAVGERVEEDRRRAALARARAHAHPRLGDDAERALGAEQHAVRRRPRARARQPAALPRAARADRPHGLDEVVDVGLDGGEMPAGAGRDPAAERRQLERLREEAHRQPVLGELSLEHRTAAPACTRAACETSSTSSTRSSAPRSSDTVPSKAPGPRGARRRPPTCRRRRGSPRRSRPRPLEHRLDLALVAGTGDDVGREAEVAAEAPDDVGVGLAPGVRRALVRVGRADVGQRRGASTRGCGSDARSSGTGSSTSASRCRDGRRSRARPRGPARRAALVLVSPAPVVAAPHRARPYRRGIFDGREPRSGPARARGPWAPEEVVARWRDEHFEPPRRARRRPPTRRSRRCASAGRRATTASPRASSATASDDGRLELELQPLRWALRLVAGRRAGVGLRALRHARARRALARGPARGVAVASGRGAGRSAPAARSTSARARPRRSRASSCEEWSVEPERLTVEALVRLPHGMVMVVGARLAGRRAPRSTPDDEHDAYAWWPADVDAVARRGGRGAAPHGATLLVRDRCSLRAAEGRVVPPLRRSTSRC